MRARSRRVGDERRTAVIAYCACAAYLHSLASLLLWASLPVLAGLAPTLILSGSMGPAISAGDIVLLGDVSEEKLTRGAVITFDDPAQPDRMLTHRIAAVLPDGTFRTRGDANAQADSTVVDRSAIRGVGRVVVPGVGVPIMWLRDQNWLKLATWAAGTMLAVSYLTAFGRARPELWGWSSSLAATPLAPSRRPSRPRRQWRPSGRGVAPRSSWLEPRATRRAGVRVGAASTAALLIVALGAVVLPRATASDSAFASATRNQQNQWGAATSFCSLTGTQTLTPVADTEIREDLTVSAGTNAALNVRSKNKNTNIRALLRFDLPAAQGCAVTATLRLNLSTANASRVLQVFNAPAAWTEGGATWGAMPEPAATPVAAATPALGWIDIPVTEHVLAMYSGTNHGFLLKDQVEGAGGSTGNTQTFASRNAPDATTWPQLVLSFGAAGAAKPPAPAGLSATALSAGRIALSWSDMSTDETGFTVQRSASGAFAWTTVATLPADATSHVDTGLASETTYDYRVRAANAQGASAWSNIASATTEAAQSAPSAPSGLSVTVSQVNSVTLAWTDTSLTEDAFTVERSPAGAATWSLAGTAAADATTYEVTGLTANTAYDFRVRATNNGGVSDWSNVAAGSTGTCASVPAQTLPSVADAMVAQGAPTQTLGTAYPTMLMTRAQTNAHIRSLVRFDDVSAPIGCSVATASLRLHVSSQTAARTLHVRQAAGAWAENTVTWANQPAGSGTAAPATTAVGWVAIPVASHVQATISAGTNDGFLVADAGEATATTTAVDVNMSSREGTNPPELVITWGP